MKKLIAFLIILPLAAAAAEKNKPSANSADLAKLIKFEKEFTKEMGFAGDLPLYSRNLVSSKGKVNGKDAVYVVTSPKEHVIYTSPGRAKRWLDAYRMCDAMAPKGKWHLPSETGNMVAVMGDLGGRKIPIEGKDGKHFAYPAWIRPEKDEQVDYLLKDGFAQVGMMVDGMGMETWYYNTRSRDEQAGLYAGGMFGSMSRGMNKEATREFKLQAEKGFPVVCEAGKLHDEKFVKVPAEKMPGGTYVNRKDRDEGGASAGPYGGGASSPAEAATPDSEQNSDSGDAAYMLGK